MCMVLVIGLLMITTVAISERLIPAQDLCRIRSAGSKRHTVCGVADAWWESSTQSESPGCNEMHRMNDGAHRTTSV
jgi:hypothetical protein